MRDTGLTEILLIVIGQKAIEYVTVDVRTLAIRNNNSTIFVIVAEVSVSLGLLKVSCKTFDICIKCVIEKFLCLNG